MKRGAASILARASLPILTRLDPELAHDLGLAGLDLLRPLWPAQRHAESAAVSCLGLHFAHPLGLAAGFDKNGDHLDALGAMGFSHIELGTVTPRPQPGNPKPRMFRIPEAGALINRMGFNNKGVDHLVAQVSRSRYAGIRGISIGKNFDTPIENAQHDYVTCLRKVYAFADYVAVNISSPNTARLRELQARDGLERILGALLEERHALQERYGKRVPLLVKVAPDLTAEQISAVAQDLRALEVDGIIATNTSTDHSSLGDAPAAAQSGAERCPAAPLVRGSDRSTARGARRRLPPHRRRRYRERRACPGDARGGANLIQIYTGFAYRGHALVEDIVDELST